MKQTATTAKLGYRRKSIDLQFIVGVMIILDFLKRFNLKLI